VTRRTEERFWYLNPTQTNLLGIALDAVPEDQRFSITLEIPIGNAQASTMGENLAEIFHQHGWSATGSTNFSLRADLVGINFAVALDWPRMDKDSPPHAAELMYILNRAGIKYVVGADNRSRNNSLLLAIGSRPPDW
jgi:hypothetical protein